jgi:hypothetical protein
MAEQNVAVSAADQVETVRSSEIPGTRFTAARLHLVNDPTVLFEEYLYFAKLTRAEEREDDWTPEHSFWQTLKTRFNFHRSSVTNEAHELQAGQGSNIEKQQETSIAKVPDTHQLYEQLYSDPNQVSDAEWRALSRSVRTVSWMTCFYLITSDIIGPFSIP